jgi:hypothetical protein
MILAGIISIFKVIALGVIGLMPAIPSMSAFVTTSLDPLIDVLVSANYFINLGLCVSCLLAVLVFANIEFVWSVLMWIIRKIPGVN